MATQRILATALLSLLIMSVPWVTAAENTPLRPAASFVEFHYDTPGAAAATRRCAEIWQAEGVAFTAKILPATISPDTVVCLVLSSTGFAQKFGNRIPDWGVGVALGPHLIALDYQRIPAVGRGIHEIFLHEMAHALLYQGAGQAWLPAWFHEGVAMRTAGEWKFWDTVSLVMDGRVPDLSRLQNHWPVLSISSSRAYRTSLLAVDRLCDQFNPHIIVAILRATNEAGSFATGFETATGQTPGEFYAEFNGAMRLRFGWVTLFSSWPGLFVLMALVFAVGALRKIVVTRRRLAAMDDRETPLNPE